MGCYQFVSKQLPQLLRNGIRDDDEDEVGDDGKDDENEVADETGKDRAKEFFPS